VTEVLDIVASALASAAAPCITCSFQAEDVVVVDMIRRVRPAIPVLFLETFHHFAETLAYRDEMAARWQLNLVNLKAAEPQVGLHPVGDRGRAQPGQPRRLWPQRPLQRQVTERLTMPQRQRLPKRLRRLFPLRFRQA